MPRSPSSLQQSQTDGEAFALFYDAYAERVLRYMTRRVLDVEVALDLMSETFALALERRHQFRGRSVEEEQGWLFAIARTQVAHYWRQGQVERDALQRVGIDPPGLTDSELERLEQRAGMLPIVRALRSALDVLTEDQRRAVELRVVDGDGYAAIAAAEQVSEDVVRARVSRGLRALAISLNAQGVLHEDLT